MAQYDVAEAKAHPSELIEAALAGDEVRSASDLLIVPVTEPGAW